VTSPRALPLARRPPADASFGGQSGYWDQQVPPRWGPGSSLRSGAAAAEGSKGRSSQQGGGDDPLDRLARTCSAPAPEPAAAEHGASAAAAAAQPWTGALGPQAGSRAGGAAAAGPGPGLQQQGAGPKLDLAAIVKQATGKALNMQQQAAGRGTSLYGHLASAAVLERAALGIKASSGACLAMLGCCASYWCITPVWQRLER
jgi:hypothetical protein